MTELSEPLFGFTKTRLRCRLWVDSGYGPTWNFCPSVETKFGDLGKEVEVIQFGWEADSWPTIRPFAPRAACLVTLDLRLDPLHHFLT